MEGTLELIALIRTPIRSLLLQDFSDDPMDWDRLRNVNFSSLRHLGLEKLQDTEKILNFVLQSDPGELTLSFTDEILGSLYTILKHDLLRRVVG
jgi:hypothetical protein